MRYRTMRFDNGEDRVSFLGFGCMRFPKRKVKIITADEAAKLVKNGDTITTSGFVASAIPEALNKAVEKRFLETGEPNNLTYVYCGSQGNKDGRGAEQDRKSVV